MTECNAERSYRLSDVQKQRLALEAMLGEPSPSWILTGAVIEGVTDLARFHEVLADLARVYPVLRTTLVTAGTAESWSQHISSCQDLERGRSPVIALPKVRSWSELTDAMHADLTARNPYYRYAAAYGPDEAGRIRVVFLFDHMVSDIRSVDVVLAHLARNARDARDDTNPRSCGCGGNEFADYLERTATVADTVQLPERYEWALNLMRAANSPHAYIDLPLARPMSVANGGGAAGISSRFVTDASRRHSYTPFAAFVSALALSLEAGFRSPAMFYAPTINRGPAEMESVGWFADTPIMPVRASQITSAVAGELVLDRVRATSEAKAATTETMRDGQALTALVYNRLSGILGSRPPFLDCRPDSLPYLVLGYADRVRERAEWTADGVKIRKVFLPSTVYPPLLLVPGYIYIRLVRVKKAEWAINSIYEAERYQDGTIKTLISSMERYLRQLLG
ncbi:MAG TPA: hypothetical protein VFQ44_30395 [Streptosporangiaceae bacterium]|nr:hypothetical protein [Streptosporangiaceae bacterium]